MNKPKIRGYITRLGLLLWPLLVVAKGALAQYNLKIVPVDKDSLFIRQQLKLSTQFDNQLTCLQYIDKLPGSLQLKGYATASVDSIVFDSSSAIIHLFVGEIYQITAIHMDSATAALVQETGLGTKPVLSKSLNLLQVQQWREKLLEYCENSGYPFASIRLDSFVFQKEKLEASLKIDKGPLYSVDSIRVIGDVSINNRFLQRYLDLKNGEIYHKKKLQNINKRLLELNYLQQSQTWDLSLLGTGAIINLYLKPKKNNQVNVLIGLLPANQTANNVYEQQVRTKLLITGEANINLRNAFGNGEALGLNAQRLQAKSGRINIYYQQPYILGSAFGAAGSFDLYQRDSSFTNINSTVGMQYTLSINKTGKVFLQSQQTNVNTIDTISIKLNKKLPNEIDISAVNVGVDYDWNSTNYRNNPRSGYEFLITASAGTKKIKKSSAIIKLSDPFFSYQKLYDSLRLQTYQFRLKAGMAKYFSFTRQTVLKTAASGGWFQSPSAFRNELFQIGGYRLLRGFDEESIFASKYAVASLEYRYLIGLNSFFFVFTDYGWIENRTVNVKLNNSFFSVGLGISLETKGGVFNIAYAAGKRNDLRFDLRQSKIHLGYVSYF